MLAQFPISRRTFVASTPVVALLAACGVGAQSATPDQLLVDSIIATKSGLLPLLTAYPDVASQQQEHLNALVPFASKQPMVTPSVMPSSNISAALANLSADTSSRALGVTDDELCRLLLLISASDAVHAQVTA